MAYQVTKLIAGREYRYQVEGYRDPQSKRVKQKWTYLGRVHGHAVVTARRRSSEGARERILGAALQLMDKRDISHLTIDVIVGAAHVSRASFYRYFPGRIAALNAAIASVYEELLEIPLRLDEPIVALDAERARLRGWVERLASVAVRRPGIHRALFASEPLRRARANQSRLNRERVVDSLVTYMQRLQEAGLVRIADPELLANGIVCATAGVVKQLAHDRVNCAPAVLIAGMSEMVCRSVFANSALQDERG